MDIEAVFRTISAVCSTVAIVSAIVCLQLSREEPVRRQRLQLWLIVLVSTAAASLVATTAALFSNSI